MRPHPFHHIEARRDELQYAIIDPVDLAANLIEVFLVLRLFHEWGIFLRMPVSKSKGLGNRLPAFHSSDTPSKRTSSGESRDPLTRINRAELTALIEFNGSRLSPGFRRDDELSPMRG